MTDAVLSLWRGTIPLHPLTGTQIISEACREFGVSRAVMLTKSHICARGGSNDHRDMRDEVMARLHDRGLSYPRIAQLMGLKDHSSVWEAVRRHAARMAEASA